LGFCGTRGFGAALIAAGFLAAGCLGFGAAFITAGFATTGLATTGATSTCVSWGASILYGAWASAAGLPRKNSLIFVNISSPMKYLLSQPKTGLKISVKQLEKISKDVALQHK
jgi:hypothetical protein